MTYRLGFVLLCGLLHAIPLHAAFHKGKDGRWVVEKNSILCVHGKSNINTFTCQVQAYNNSDTITFFNEKRRPIKLSGDLQMDVLDFDCHNRMITRDFRKTLKADQYPVMTIHFQTLNDLPYNAQPGEMIKGWVAIELAGVIRRFEIDYTFSNVSSTLLQINGGHHFCFSDFDLSPPTKFGGLVRLKDEFQVNFQLMLREL